eukprot:s3494_g5.t1
MVLLYHCATVPYHRTVPPYRTTVPPYRTTVPYQYGTVVRYGGTVVRYGGTVRWYGTVVRYGGTMVQYTGSVWWYSGAHRVKWIEIRIANPVFRLRTDMDLGPRMVVKVDNTTRSTLKKPEEWFVALDVYLKDNPNETVDDSKKVNIRTGKAGYYQREQASDKTSSLSVTVHDSDQSLGSSSDLGNRVWRQASRAVNPNPVEAIDALDIPFFQLGNHPVLRFGGSNAASLSSISSVPIPSSAASAASRAPMSTLMLSENNLNDPGSDDEMAPQMGGNAFDAIQQAIPCHSFKENRPVPKAQPARAKTQTTRTASSAAQPAGAQSKKRKTVGSEDASAQQAPSAKIIRLANEGSVKNNANATMEGDRQLLADFNEKMIALKDKVLASIKDTDSGVNDTLKAAHKDLTAYINTVKTKKKSLKRRKDADQLISGLSSIIEETQKVMDMISALQNNTGTTETLSVLKSLDSSWKVAGPIFKRAFKCITLSCLKFSDWQAFYGLRDSIIEEFNSHNGQIFFELMVNELIQRLLRALPVKGSWTSESLQPITSFFTFMSSKISEGHLAKSLEHLQVVVCHEQHVPAKIIDAINYMHAASQDTTPTALAKSDSGLVAVFTGITQGKAMVKIAHTAALQAQQETGHLQELSNTMKEISDLLDSLPSCQSFDWTKMLDAGVRSCGVLADAYAKQSSGSSKTMVADAKKKLSEFVSAVCKAFLLGPFQDWIVKWVSHYDASKEPSADMPESLKKWSTTGLNSKYLLKDAHSRPCS